MYQASCYFAAVEVDVKNVTGRIAAWNIIELVLRKVMYLIRYFQDVKCVDC